MTSAVATRYSVRAGDTLGAIAERFDTTVKALARANHLRNINLIRVGQVLLIPAAPPQPQAATRTRYVVRPGDTLSQIAERLGTTVTALVRANHLPDPDMVRVGQVLQVRTAVAPRDPATVPSRPRKPVGPRPEVRPGHRPGPGPQSATEAAELAGVGDLTRAQLLGIMPLAKRVADTYLEPLNAAMREARITTPLRRAAFLAQLAHESAQLRFMEEIASGEAYEGRADLGNVKPGDGKRFKGRGPIQLTGRTNYRDAGHALGLDLLANPARVADPDVGFRVAGWFWTTRGLNSLADAGKFDSITRRINGGLNGKTSRDGYYAVARKVLRA